MSYVTPKKNAAYKFAVGLVDQSNTKLLKANPTLSAGDVQVSIDGGAFANLTTLPTVTPASGKRVEVSLSAAEMNGDNITVVFSDAAGSEWCDFEVNIQTTAQQIDDLASQATVAAIKTKTDNLPASPAATSDIPTTAAIADKILGRNIGGGSDGGRTVMSALRKLRNKITIAAGLLSVFAEDDTTLDHTENVVTTPGDPVSSTTPNS